MWPQLEIVGVAAKGIAAVGMMSALKPGFAFLDIRMAGLDGVQVARMAGHADRRNPLNANDSYL